MFWFFALGCAQVKYVVNTYYDLFAYTSVIGYTTGLLIALATVAQVRPPSVLSKAMYRVAVFLRRLKGRPTDFIPA